MRKHALPTCERPAVVMVGQSADALLQRYLTAL